MSEEFRDASVSVKESEELFQDVLQFLSSLTGSVSAGNVQPSPTPVHTGAGVDPDALDALAQMDSLISRTTPLLPDPEPVPTPAQAADDPQKTSNYFIVQNQFNFFNLPRENQPPAQEDVSFVFPDSLPAPDVEIPAVDATQGGDSLVFPDFLPAPDTEVSPVQSDAPEDLLDQIFREIRESQQKTQQATQKDTFVLPDPLPVSDAILPPAAAAGDFDVLDQVFMSVRIDQWINEITSGSLPAVTMPRPRTKKRGLNQILEKITVFKKAEKLMTPTENALRVATNAVFALTCVLVFLGAFLFGLRLPLRPPKLDPPGHVRRDGACHCHDMPLELREGEVVRLCLPIENVFEQPTQGENVDDAQDDKQHNRPHLRLEIHDIHDARNRHGSQPEEKQYETRSRDLRRHENQPHYQPYRRRMHHSSAAFLFKDLIHRETQ